MQITCIHFSIKWQKIKLAGLIIGLLSRRKQGGTKKILYEAKTPFFDLCPEATAEPFNISGHDIRYDGVTDVIKPF
jgi:hypothetical protein